MSQVKGGNAGEMVSVMNRLAGFSKTLDALSVLCTNDP